MPPLHPGPRAHHMQICELQSLSRRVEDTQPTVALIDVHAGARGDARTERVCRGALSCEMIPLSCGLGGIYFPITLLWLVCLMDSVDLCAGVDACTRVQFSLNNKVPFCVAYISPWWR